MAQRATCDNILSKAILLEVNSTWLITSQLANQRARKVLFAWLLLELSLLSNIPLFRREYKRGERVNTKQNWPFRLFACQTPVNCDKGYCVRDGVIRSQWLLSNGAYLLGNKLKGWNTRGDKFLGIVSATNRDYKCLSFATFISLVENLTNSNWFEKD